MTEFLAIVFLALVLSVLILWFLYRNSSKAVKEYRSRESDLIAQIEHQENIIIRLQEAQRVQTVRTEKITTGSVPDRVAGSVDVLQDIARVGAARRAGNN